MGIFRQFPYSNFHEMNMDEILKIVTDFESEWENMQLSFEELVAYVHTYFDNIDEETAIAVANWIESHPEYVTTVQDNSLTSSKFTNQLKLEAIKDYVTPEMFGAIGDGVTDDTQAIKDALATKKPMLLMGTYLISETLILDEDTSDTIFSFENEKYHNPVIKGDTLPLLETQVNAISLIGITFLNTGSYSTTTPIININNREMEDADTLIKRCSFQHNSYGIHITGRNAELENNLFYDMNSSGICIKLSYVQYNDDAEWSHNVNNFNRYKDGNRGFRIINNRTHYTRNFLVDTTDASCQYMHGLEITGNYLEAGSIITGYVVNALISDNITTQLFKNNFIIDSIGMDNVNISNNHWVGNNSFVSEEGVTVGEAYFNGGINVNGNAYNCNITDNFISNLQIAYARILGNFTGKITGTVVVTPALTGSNVIACTGTMKAEIDIVILGDSTPANLKSVLSFASEQQGVSGQYKTNLTGVAFSSQKVGHIPSKNISYSGSGDSKTLFLDYPYSMGKVWDYYNNVYTFSLLGTSKFNLNNYSIDLSDFNELNHTYFIELVFSNVV